MPKLLWLPTFVHTACIGACAKTALASYLCPHCVQHAAALVHASQGPSGGGGSQPGSLGRGWFPARVPPGLSACWHATAYADLCALELATVRAGLTSELLLCKLRCIAANLDVDTLMLLSSKFLITFSCLVEMAFSTAPTHCTLACCSDCYADPLFQRRDWLDWSHWVLAFSHFAAGTDAHQAGRHCTLAPKVGRTADSQYGFYGDLCSCSCWVDCPYHCGLQGVYTFPDQE